MTAPRWQAASTGVAALMLFALALVVVVQRSPTGSKAWHGTGRAKGAVPHARLGKWYPPSSLVRTFYDLNERRYFAEPGQLQRRWHLGLTVPGVVASLQATPGQPDGFRVEVAAVPTADVSTAHVKDSRIPLEANRTYRLSFSYRSDAERYFRVALVQTQAPWKNLGYSRDLTATPIWTSHMDTIRLAASDTLGGLHFDVGGTPGVLEVAGIKLTDADGSEIQPFVANRYAVTYRINSLGCRGAEPDRGSAGLLRVLILGDSYALGSGVLEHDTFGMRLERQLHAQGRTEASVQTCAVPGYGAREARTLYERIARRWAPQVVVLSVHPNDDRMAVDDAQVSFPGPGVGDEPSPTENRRTYEADSTSIARIGQHVRALRDRLQARGVELIVVMLRNTPHQSWDLLATQLRSPGDSARFVDIGDRWRGVDWTSLWVHPQFDSHPNEHVHQMTADALIERVGQRAR